jgi:hypothetical protein
MFIQVKLQHLCFKNQKGKQLNMLSEVATFVLQKSERKKQLSILAAWHMHSANMQSRIAIKEQQHAG